VTFFWYTKRMTMGGCGGYRTKGDVSSVVISVSLLVTRRRALKGMAVVVWWEGGLKPRSRDAADTIGFFWDCDRARWLSSAPIR
jgi:hypothetical protein